VTETVIADRRKPGPSRSLTRDRVVAAGLELMARDGLSSVSLRAVAQHLGVDHKTLYTYVSDKDDLLAGMFDSALSALDMPGEGDPRAPAEQVVDLFVSIRRVLMANIDLFHLTRPKNVVGTDWAAGARVLTAIMRLVPDYERAAELFANLTHLAVGSAMESMQARDSAFDVTQLEGPPDPATHPHHAGFTLAWSGLDREQAFERLVREIVSSASR
jgi:AcrR family transcriptional regulator